MKLQKLMHFGELHRSNATVVLIKLMCIFTSSYASIFFGIKVLVHVLYTVC